MQKKEAGGIQTRGACDELVVRYKYCKQEQGNNKLRQQETCMVELPMLVREGSSRVHGLGTCEREAADRAGFHFVARLRSDRFLFPSSWAWCWTPRTPASSRRPTVARWRLRLRLRRHHRRRRCRRRSSSSAAPPCGGGSCGGTRRPRT